MARAPTGRTNRVVVLNASYEVLSVVALHRAVAYLRREKAEIVAQRDGAAMHSSSGLSIPVPTVVRLLRYVRVPYRHQVPAWTKAGLLRRDRHTCAYCGHRGATVEHLVPVSRGGRSTWANTVVACVSCNTRKGNRTPEEAGMVLLRRPTIPTVQTALLLGLADTERDVLDALGLAGHAPAFGHEVRTA
jgi:5-methylcytosine-specific restriction endonuclease McrA